MRSRARKTPDGSLCERCEFFQGWSDRVNPRGVRLIKCKAIDALVQPPYERCPAFKPVKAARPSRPREARSS